MSDLSRVRKYAWVGALFLGAALALLAWRITVHQREAAAAHKVSPAIQAEREQHLSSHDAIRQACLLRFRPIMMTTMAALLGALPLALGRGTGSELRQPLGYTMVGGLVLSQALTLFTTPVIYLYFDKLSLKFKRRRKQITMPADDPGAAPPRTASPLEGA